MRLVRDFDVDTLTVGVVLDPGFRGLDRTELWDFLFWVVRLASDEGRLDDDEWTARLAVRGMSKPVLRWYIQRDPEVQESWRLLRRALIDNWTLSKERIILLERSEWYVG